MPRAGVGHLPSPKAAAPHLPIGIMAARRPLAYLDARELMGQISTHGGAGPSFSASQSSALHG